MGKYDQLNEIETTNQAICFTDQNFTSKTWEVRKIFFQPKIFRKIKICPHLFLPDHHQNIWIDGNISPVDIDSFIENKSGFWIMDHPHRKCIYQEALRCIESGKDAWDVISQQVDRYRMAGYPSNEGMITSSVLIRDNDQKTRNFSQAWWNEVSQYSVRDQLSFNFVAWKLKLRYQTFPFLQGFNVHQHLSYTD